MSAPAEIQGGSIWKGLQRRIDPSDLPGDFLPDQSNCEHRKGRVGILGPRPGFAMVNANPFNGRVVGLIPLELPSGRINLTAIGDGTILPTQAPPASQYMVYPSQESLASEASFIMNYPATSFSASENFSAAATFDLSASTYSAVGFQFRMVIASAVAAQTFRPVVNVYMIIDGNAIRMFDLDMTLVLNGDLTMLVDLNAVSSVGGFSFAHGSLGTASGLRIDAELRGGWPASAASGDAFSAEGVLIS